MKSKIAPIAMFRRISGEKTQYAEDQKWNGLYTTSGVLLIVTAVLWTVVTQTSRILYTSGYPADPAAYLQLISQHQGLAAITWSLWIVADFLLIAPTVALYIILRRTNRTLALLGSMFAMFFNIYDVCVTELNSLTLVSLSNGYAAASAEVAKAPFVAAASYGYYALPLQTFLSFAIGTFGYLLWCLPMYRSPFRRFAAFFGTVWCVIALIGSASPFFPSSYVLGLFQYLCVPAVALWFILVGLQLFRHGQRLPAEVVSAAVPA